MSRPTRCRVRFPRVGRRHYLFPARRRRRFEPSIVDGVGDVVAIPVLNLAQRLGSREIGCSSEDCRYTWSLHRTTWGPGGRAVLFEIQQKVADGVRWSVLPWRAEADQQPNPVPGQHPPLVRQFFTFFLGWAALLA